MTIISTVNTKLALKPNTGQLIIILVLKTLIDKYIKNKGKLYTCFVDFAKCFDTIWQDGLFYKLLKYNIGGLFYTVLKDMYNKSMCSVKVAGGKT